MNDALYEQLVTRKSRPMDLVIRILCIAALVVVLCGGMLFIGSLAVLVTILLGVLIYYFVFPKLDVEYEYTLLNHDLEIDAIYSKSKRKKLCRYWQSNINKKIAVKDFFSHFTAIFLSHGTSSCPSIAAYDPASFHPDRSGYSSSSVQPGLQWHKYLRLYLRKNLLSCLRVQNQDGENFLAQ